MKHAFVVVLGAAFVAGAADPPAAGTPAPGTTVPGTPAAAPP